LDESPGRLPSSNRREPVAVSPNASTFTEFGKRYCAGSSVSREKRTVATKDFRMTLI
jgi:hypothetical protein